ncbi:MAG: NAD+ synthase [Alphaproteobacteria bacterium]|nr:NAD+ synthase [Alphaproteobacteria bacterium]
MKIALAQINPTVGNIVGNVGKIRMAMQDASQQGVDLLITPELCVTGYPIEDLALRPSFQDDVMDAILTLAEETVSGTGLIIGTPWMDNGQLYNAAILLDGGNICGKVFKRHLPNYGPFDDKRIFSEGQISEPLDFRNHKIGVMICEDMWSAEVPRRLKRGGAELFIVLNGSPYELDKQHERQSIARARVIESGLPLAYINLIGGQDELVFDGASFVLDAKGEVVSQASSWVEDVLVSDWQEMHGSMIALPGRIERIPEATEAQYRAVLLGLQDYVRKNGFKDIILGLSGGIDSALVAVLAVDALGADHVHTVMLPSVYTAPESMEDAAAVAKALGCKFDVISITPAVDVFGEIMSPVFGDYVADSTQENIQSRCRGVILMAMANRFNKLLLATGNKSEMSTGYATLYGDMCGAFAPLKDLYKTEVYELSHYAVSRNGPVIPERIFKKPPSAELRPGQVDEDSLPPYEVLDAILYSLIEGNVNFGALVDQGYDLMLVKQVWSMLQLAEYKRQQAPPGPKVSRRHLSKDRRYPITNGYIGG